MVRGQRSAGKMGKLVMMTSSTQHI